MALSGVITGKKGGLKQGASYAAGTAINITNISFRETGGTISTNDSSNSTDYVPKIPAKYAEWTMECDGILNYDDTELVINTEYTVYIIADDTSGDEVYWSGTAILIEKGFEIPIEGSTEKCMRHLSFEGSGAITKTDASAV